jgi:hypothetical protein
VRIERDAALGGRIGGEQEDIDVDAEPVLQQKARFGGTG